MDERALKELELLTVARLYGLQQAPAAASPVSEAPAVAAAAFAEAAPPVAAPRAARMIGEATLDQLRVIASDCRLCGLCRGRKQAVFGVGSPSGPWMFIGEGPGADEDEQGEPFVGQAGKLLDSMLTAIGCQRGRDTYIANVVKCRPPGNRTPTLEEATACAPYLDRQIELIAPKMIVALGKTAATRLLGTETSLASLRGKVHRYKGTPVVVTYHPAYLLRSLPEKSKAWEDLLFARKTLQMPVS